MLTMLWKNNRFSAVLFYCWREVMDVRRWFFYGSWIWVYVQRQSLQPLTITLTLIYAAISIADEWRCAASLAQIHSYAHDTCDELCASDYTVYDSWKLQTKHLRPWCLGKGVSTKLYKGRKYKNNKKEMINQTIRDISHGAEAIDFDLCCTCSGHWHFSRRPNVVNFHSTAGHF